MNEMINPMITNESFSSRCQKVLQVARQLYQGKPDWVTFFRETLGVNGAARSVFPNQEEYAQFEQSSEFAEVQKLVANLRTRRIAQGGSKHEPTRVITVRLPESLHEALKAEANDHNTSMNKLCISKLLQVLVDGEKQGQPQSAPQPTPTAQPALQRRATLPLNPPTGLNGTLGSSHGSPGLGSSSHGPSGINSSGLNSSTIGSSGPATLQLRSALESTANNSPATQRFGQ